MNGTKASMGAVKGLGSQALRAAHMGFRLWASYGEGLLTPTLVFLMALVFFLTHRHIALQDSNLLYPWDTTWYKSIIENGYVFDGDLFKNQNVAFMPLYPLSVFFIKRLFAIQETYRAMLLTSSLFTYISTVLLYRILASHYVPEIALGAILAFLFFPYSFYLFNGYAEPCFMACAMLFFYFLTRERYWSAAITASLSFLAKQVGVILMGVYVFTLMGQILVNYKRRPVEARQRGLLLLETCPVLFFGMAIFTVYLYLRFSDPLLFSNILISWTQTVTPAAVDVTAILKSIRNLYYSLIISLRFTRDPVAMAYIFALISFFSISFCVLSKKIKQIHFICYVILMLAFNIAFRPNTMNPDLGRYMLMNFPFYITVPMITSLIAKESSRWYWLALGCILAFFMAHYGHHVHLFYHGQWVS